MSLWLIFTSIVLFGWMAGWVYRDRPYIGMGLFTLLGGNSIGSVFYGIDAFLLVQMVLLVVVTLTWISVEELTDGSD